MPELGVRQFCQCARRRRLRVPDQTSRKVDRHLAQVLHRLARDHVVEVGAHFGGQVDCRRQRRRMVAGLGVRQATRVERLGLEVEDRERGCLGSDRVGVAGRHGGATPSGHRHTIDERTHRSRSDRHRDRDRVKRGGRRHRRRRRAHDHAQSCPRWTREVPRDRPGDAPAGRGHAGRQIVGQRDLTAIRRRPTHIGHCDQVVVCELRLRYFGRCDAGRRPSQSRVVRAEATVDRLQVADELDYVTGARRRRTAADAHVARTDIRQALQRLLNVRGARVVRDRRSFLRSSSGWVGA